MNEPLLLWNLAFWTAYIVTAATILRRRLTPAHSALLAACACAALVMAAP